MKKRQVELDTDLSDVEKALEDIAEKEAVVEETTQNDKKKVDSAKAAEMRNRVLDRFLTIDPVRVR